LPEGCSDGGARTSAQIELYNEELRQRITPELAATTTALAASVTPQTQRRFDRATERNRQLREAIARLGGTVT
jgi:hypothetical protein